MSMWLSRLLQCRVSSWHGAVQCASGSGQCGVPAMRLEGQRRAMHRHADARATRQSSRLLCTENVSVIALIFLGRL